MTAHAEDTRASGTPSDRAVSPEPTTAVNTSAARRDAEDALGAAARLQEYRDYLTRARAAKARRGSTAASSIDREALAHGRRALADARTLSTSALALVRNLSHGGAFDAAAASWVRGVQATGPVRIADAWERLVASDDGPSAMRRAGVGESVLRALGEGVRAVDAHVSADGSRLVVEGTRDGRQVRGALETAARPARPTGVMDLLTRGRFAALTDAVARGQPAYLDGVAPPRGDVRAEELVLFGALGVLRDGTRHVRKLEDAGLATYEGGAPGVVAALLAIGVVLFVIGAIVVIAECKEENPSTGDSGACGVGRVLQALSAALLLYLFFSGDTPAPGTATNVALGSVLVHGVVRDLGRTLS
jgi:hypothetical protein